MREPSPCAHVFWGEQVWLGVQQMPSLRSHAPEAQGLRPRWGGGVLVREAGEAELQAGTVSGPHPGQLP